MSMHDVDDPIVRRELARLAPEVSESEGRLAIARKVAGARRRRLVAVGAVGALVLVGSATLLAVTVEDDEPTVVADDEGAPTTSGAVGVGPSVVAEVASSQVAGLRITSSATRPAANAWLEHDLLLVNDSEETVVIRLHPRSDIVKVDAAPVLLVGDDGCGYGTTGGVVTTACRSVGRPPIELEPGQTHSATITLWRDLPGFADLPPGSYEVRRTIEVAPASARDAWESADLVITYHVPD